MTNPNAIISLADGSPSILIGKPGARPSNPIPDRNLSPSNHIEYWGDDNLEPQHLLKDAQSNPTLWSSLDFIVKALYSAGLEYGYEETEAGQKTFFRESIPEIEQFLKVSNHGRQLAKGFMDLAITRNTFPELVLTKDRKKVFMLKMNDATFCRWGKVKNDGIKRSCHISANWGNYGTSDKNKIIVPVLDSTFGYMEGLGAGNKFKYILPDLNFPTAGNVFYSMPVWNAIRTSGWLEYANQIPKFKKAYLKNASHIKYVVHVPESWWKWKYSDWDTNEKERAKRVKDTHDNFNKFLTGIENAGKSLMLTFSDEQVMNNAGYTQWKIEAIDKKVIDNILTGDLLDITQMIYQAVGVHATLRGGAPGASNLGAGSGSDQREAYNIFMALSTLEQEIICKPYEIASEFNGFPGIKFRINNQMIAQLQTVTPQERFVQNK